MKTKKIIAIFLVLFLGLSGLYALYSVYQPGEEKSEVDHLVVEDVITAFFTHLSNKEYSKAHLLTVPEFQKQMPLKDFQEITSLSWERELIIKQEPRAFRIEIKKDEASVNFELLTYRKDFPEPTKANATYKLKKISDNWLIDFLDNTN